MTARYRDVDDYIAALSPDARGVMTAARAAIHAGVPGAGETISYQMPTFTLAGSAFLHVGAWKQHLGVYPVPVLDEPLEVEVAPYRATSGTLRFTYRAGVPFELLGRIAAATVARREQGRSDA